MQTITVDIINNKAIRLLYDLELLQLIRVRREKNGQETNWVEKYKGVMDKQPLSEIDDQADEIRSEWE